MGDDLVLQPFLQAADEPTAALALTDLIDTHAKPLIRDIVRRRARTGLDRQQSEDLCQDVIVHLLARLNGRRANADSDAILEFTRYVAAIAHRACDARIRSRYPRRARLKSRVRYAVTRHPSFVLTDEGTRGWMCGLRRWPVQGSPATGHARLQELRLRREPLPGLTGEDPQDVALTRLIGAVLDWVAAPVELDDLVSCLADLLSVVDREEALADRADGCAQVRDRQTPADVALVTREYVERLWTEIGALPVRQRVALLLNLRDERGRGVIPLIALTGTASVEQIAGVLEMTVAGLEAVWGDLPLDDAALGRRLALTRQQIINLRKAARLRLKRNMRRFERGE